MTENATTPQHIEIRCFGALREVFSQLQYPFPLLFELRHECFASEVAEQIGLPLDRVEAVFINHKATALSEARVKPGDRVGFIPVGTPGPYRVLLGVRNLAGERRGE